MNSFLEEEIAAIAHEECPILSKMRKICTENRSWKDDIDIVKQAQSLKPQSILFDYTVAEKIRLSWLTENGRGCGTSKSFVTHAICDRTITLKRTTRNVGDALCGFKSSSKWGRNDWESRQDLDANCPKCAEAIAIFGLQKSIKPEAIAL